MLWCAAGIRFSSIRVADIDRWTGFVGRDGRLSPYSWRTYQTRGTICRSCTQLHDGVELLVRNADTDNMWRHAHMNPRYNWVIILPAELSASAVLINYWNKSVNNAVWISICMVVVIVINMFGAGTTQDSFETGYSLSDS